MRASSIGAPAEGQIREHEIEGVLPDGGDGLVSGARDVDVVALPPQQPRKRELNRALILDDQDPRLHGCPRPLEARLGKVNRNSAPAPGSDDASMVPPWASTSFLQMASPRPVPLVFEV